MSDHTQHLKDTYWEIKYREWRTFILILPFVTLIVGAALTYTFFPRVIYSTVEQVAEMTRNTALPDKLGYANPDPSANVTTLPCDGATRWVEPTARNPTIIAPGCTFGVFVSSGLVSVTDLVLGQNKSYSHAFLATEMGAVFSPLGHLVIVTDSKAKVAIVSGLKK